MVRGPTTLLATKRLYLAAETLFCIPAGMHILAVATTQPENDTRGRKRVIQRIAVIGSFRKHYNSVLEAIEVFQTAGLEVTSPLGSDVLEPGIPFVRFTTDSTSDDDPTVQSVTVRRIFQAELVYVVAPSGYIGRTTCYEIGRLIEAEIPIYFSHIPDDLPIFVPSEFVLDPVHVVELFLTGSERPRLIFSTDPHPSHEVERMLANERRSRRGA